MEAQIENAADGRRLCIVTFPEECANPAQAPTIRVVWELEWDDDFTSETNPPVLTGPLSCTRTDTGETVALDKDTLARVKKTAVQAARTDHPDW